jgi:hypothetical protein
LGYTDGFNPYLYVHDNPVNFNDPNGLWGLAISNSATQFLNYFSSGQFNNQLQTTASALNDASANNSNLSITILPAQTAIDKAQNGDFSGFESTIALGTIAGYTLPYTTGLSTVVVDGAGTTVLGSYPQYIELAQQLGANYFSIPAEEWAQMTAAEQWAANQAFLDAAIARGDNFLLSNAVTDASSYLAREIQYLIDNGMSFKIH